MAVTSCREIWRGRGGSFRGLFEYELTRVFRVITNNQYDDTTVILAAGVLPAIGAADTISPALTVRGYSFDHPEDTPFVWEVSVEYSSAPIDTDQPEPEDPLSLEPVYQWNASEREEVMYFDRDGRAVTNSAGDPFETPVKRDATRWTVTCTINTAEIPANYASYANTVNGSTIVVDTITITPEAALFKPKSISGLKRQNGIWYRELQWELHLDVRLWYAEILDAGYNQTAPIREGVSESVRQPIIMPDGSKASVPQLLNGSGVWLGADSQPWQAVFLLFPKHPKANLSAIPGIG